MYKTGLSEDTRGDQTQALLWYQRAAAAGNTDAMFRLGYDYETGKGTEKNYSEAMYWFQTASNAGNSNATMEISGLYMNGWGVPQNYPMATEYMRAAADAGNGTAMYNMGIIFEHGIGEDVNLDAAITWYRMAAVHGIAASKNALIRLNVSVVPDASTSSASIPSVTNPQPISPKDVVPDPPKQTTDSVGYPDQPGDVAGKTYQEARPVGAYQWSDLSPQEQAALTRPGIQDPAGQFNQIALQSQDNPGLVPTTPKTQMLESEYGLPITTGPVTDMGKIAEARSRQTSQKIHAETEVIPTLPAAANSPETTP